MEFRQFISILPAFEGLTNEELDALLQVLHYEPHIDGHAFFTQGGPQAGMYVLLDGGVRVSHYDDAGTAVDTQELRSGDVFGLLGLVEDMPATATAKAVGPTGVVTLNREGFLWLGAAAPALAQRLEYMVAVQLARELQLRNRLIRARLRGEAAATA
ncbi:MAG TPA: cyclic nucleotide-binding domain-containing protein [Rhodocyclaceae bacterium]